MKGAFFGANIAFEAAGCTLAFKQHNQKLPEAPGKTPLGKELAFGGATPESMTRLALPPSSRC